MKSTKSNRSSTTNLDSQYDNDQRGRRNVENRSNPSDNPQTGIDDDDDDYSVENIESYDYSYEDEGIVGGREYDDTEHEHDYSVPVAEEDEDDYYYYNENNPQDDRF